MGVQKTFLAPVLWNLFFFDLPSLLPWGAELAPGETTASLWGPSQATVADTALGVPSQIASCIVCIATNTTGSGLALTLPIPLPGQCTLWPIRRRRRCSLSDSAPHRM